MAYTLKVALRGQSCSTCEVSDEMSPGSKTNELLLWSRVVDVSEGTSDLALDVSAPKEELSASIPGQVLEEEELIWRMLLVC